LMISEKFSLAFLMFTFIVVTVYTIKISSSRDLAFLCLLSYLSCLGSLGLLGGAVLRFIKFIDLSLLG
jgi:hypothetical protein